MEREPVKMVGESTHYAYAYLLNGAKSFRLSANEHREGSGYCRLSAVLFSAFAVEAAINHVGFECLPDWEANERKSWQTKLKLIAERYGLDASLGKRPFQTVRQLFQFRDAIAHGRTTTQQIEFTDPPQSEADYLAGDPEFLKEFRSDEAVQRAIDDAEASIEFMFARAGLPHSVHVSGTWTAFQKDADRT